MSDLINNVRNQHFISQVEQRWNAYSNSNNPSKARICKYRILDKENFLLQECNKPLIKNTSAKDDLFTLELFNSGARLNLEKYFGALEEKYTKIVSKFHSSVMHKIESDKSKSIDAADLFDEIKYLQKIKMLNYIRNPHNIKEALATFSFCKDYIVEGNGENFEAIYNALKKKDNSTRKLHICEVYNITPSEFDSWIKLIILFVYFDDEKSSSTIDGMIEEYFKAGELYTTVIISYYTDSMICPVIPDTGSIIYPDLSYLFNVSKECFILLNHMPIDSDKSEEIMRRSNKYIGGNYNDDTLEEFKKLISGKIKISLHVDDLNLLEQYNKYCIRDSVDFVYSASPEVAGAEVIGKTCGPDAGQDSSKANISTEDTHG